MNQSASKHGPFASKFSNKLLKPYSLLPDNTDLSLRKRLSQYILFKFSYHSSNILFYTSSGESKSTIVISGIKKANESQAK